ncbi:hypothetical protein NE237_014538 [Protea cynaroides]|uniref:Phosphoglycerate mutase n=1 Tax=Protea cynaroides TaxID=273540 RepID=A0A9Q0KCA4_9MAGN|nr:hypothetical protein NE237_014538 [Protea cynaroides]
MEMKNSTSHNPCLPKRIILLRHGESEGNGDDTAYINTTASQIPLTKQGIEQARLSGEHIYRLVSDNDSSQNWKVYFYVSPHHRSRSTLREIGKAFPRNRIIGVREECRIREQDFGNHQEKERMRDAKDARQRFGRFFYRFPEGESAADVYDRLSSFLESLWRDIDMKRILRHSKCDDDEINLIIVTHGLTLRVFLMKWFKWTVEQFVHLKNPDNCKLLVIELGSGGKYSLAINHSDDDLLRLGLSPEMIDDQKWRATANKGDRNENCFWRRDGFFDHLRSSDSDDNNKNNVPQDQDAEKGKGKGKGKQRPCCRCCCRVLTNHSSSSSVTFLTSTSLIVFSASSS